MSHPDVVAVWEMAGATRSPPQDLSAALAAYPSSVARAEIKARQYVADLEGCGAIDDVLRPAALNGLT